MRRSEYVRTIALLALTVGLGVSVLVDACQGRLFGQDTIPPYQRGDWRHWTDADQDCQNVRAEVLIDESVWPVTFASERQCRVVEGQWTDAYTGRIYRHASELQIDHVVSLKEAHDSGGWDWTPDQKRLYANDLRHPDHLVATASHVNMSKGARGPDEWRPPNVDRWCWYARTRMGIKLRWGLTVTEPEVLALAEMLQTCQNTP